MNSAELVNIMAEMNNAPDIWPECKKVYQDTPEMLSYRLPSVIEQWR
jgi:hypothetical protein